jgi:hypothetical protein
MVVVVLIVTIVVMIGAVFVDMDSLYVNGTPVMPAPRQNGDARDRHGGDDNLGVAKLGHASRSATAVPPPSLA